MTDTLARVTAALGERYQIERELGGGGMSRVFLARELGLDREVVIKVLPDDVAASVSIERFSREIQLAASLQQANIVPLLATGDAGGTPFFTMPFVHGQSLRVRLAHKPLTVQESVSVLRDVARALSYAHSRGVVHRDIKPDNVLLSHGAAVVTDFGIAKAVSASRTAGAETLTVAGASIGTPSYMAPEQVAGDPGVGQAVDLYAWGCMAYELLSGAPPFVRESAQRVLAAHLTESPQPLTDRAPQAPVPLARLVMRCLEKDPAQRPASADEVLRDLEAVFTPGSGEVSPSVPPRPIAVRKAWTPRAGLFALAALAIAAVTWTVMMRDREGAAGTPPPAPAGTPNERSIAVLPLANLSGDKADDYFGIGLAEEMTRALSKTGVRVIGRTSAGALQARGLDERAIAKELGVGSLLTGSVQREAGQVRINVSLVSATDGAVTWNERYDRPLKNVFALQDEIARAVATELLGSLGGVAPVPTRVETSDPEAYALYLQGQVLFGRRTSRTVQQAISLFERAVARDPQFARAHAALALAITALPYYEPGTQTGQTIAPRVYAAAERAIAIDSTVAEAWGAIAAAQMNTYENRKADANFRRAQALDSTIAILWGWHALNLSHMGRLAEARDRAARAQAAEPASLIARTWGAQLLMTEKRYEAVDSATREILAMDSTYALAWDVRAEALSHLGRHDEAINALERNLAQLPADRVHETEGILAYVYARAGRADDTRRVIDRIRAKAKGELPSMAILAAALEQLGDHSAALVQLERAVRQPDAWLQMYNRSARYESLRRDPRGKAALESIEKW